MSSTREIRAGRAFVELFADNRKLVAGLRHAESRVKAFGGRLRGIGSRMMKVSAMFALPMLAGGKVFADFEEQMANVSTMLDEPEKHMGRFRKGIRAMAVEFGESTDTLAGGLYDILSASVAPEKALEVLAVAAKSAKAGLTDTKTAADAITTVLNAYGLSADHAGDVSDLLFSIVKRGKTTFAQIAPSIGNVATIAATAGISFEELGAALSVMTRNGVQTDNAITALNAILSSFLKPSSEATAYARKLGFEMSSATLKSEGLAGVFERINKLPPDAIAKLFPNVRALKGVLPALGNMEGFVKDMDAMSKRAGATEAAYGKMSKTLSHSFRQIKQSALVSLSVIGEAMGPMLSKLAETIKSVSLQIIEWIGKNQSLIATVAKVTAAVLAGGLAVAVLGTVISGLGSALGVLATVAAGVGTVFGILGSVIAFLLTPIGAVIAGVGALGAYLVYATGAGGKALTWLGEKFGVLRDDAATAYQGIAAALASGDIAQAAKILWLTLKMEWTRGINFLETAWLNFRNFFIKIGFDAWSGLLGAVETVWHGLEVGWIETVAFLSKAWTKFTSFFARTWQHMKAWAKKAWTWIKGLFDDSTAESRSKVYAEIDHQRDSAISEIDDSEKRDLAQREADRQRKREQSTQTHDATMKQIGDENQRQHTGLDSEYQNRMAENESDLKKARDEWSAAIAQARSPKPVKANDDAPGALAPPDEIVARAKNALAGMGSLLADHAAKIGSQGTFNAANVQGLQAGGVTDRMANGIDKIERNTRALRNAQEMSFN